jgi:hypothetical protein
MLLAMALCTTVKEFGSFQKPLTLNFLANEPSAHFVANQGLARKKKLGGDLLSHTLACSTIGDEGLDF